MCVIVCGAVNDCIEQCSCQEQYIYCSDLFHRPNFFVGHPQNIIGIYINTGYLASLDFVKQFPNLEFLVLRGVLIDCDLVWNATIPVHGTDCPGKFFFVFFYISCACRLIFLEYSVTFSSNSYHSFMLSMLLSTVLC